MPHYALHKFCAHPRAIAWVLGAGVLNAATIAILSTDVSLNAMRSDSRLAVYLMLALIPGTLLGYFAGMFTCYPTIDRFCRKFNGAPFDVGDCVAVLSGPWKGTAAVVNDIRPSQGGLPLICLDLGTEARKPCSNFFDEYSLLKLNRGDEFVVAKAG